MKTFKSSDGTAWTVSVSLPGSSNAMIVFRHPDGHSSGQDRYNWVLSQGPEARSVTGRLAPEKLMDALSEGDIASLFRRSMPITRTAPGSAAGPMRGNGRPA
jgi:hypothetical protein